jgi:hypothetical protein
MRFPFFVCILALSLGFVSDLPAQPAQPAPSALSRITQPLDDTVRTTLTGNVHPMARRAFDQGEAPDNLPLPRMLLVLKPTPQQEAALQQLLQDQQDIHSSAYHRWLTPEQFGERFGPSASDVDAVTQWLASNGFQVAAVSKSRLFIEFSGTAAQVKQALHAPIHSFIVNGQQHWANAANPSVPTALAPLVAGIDSLHNFERQAQHISLGTYSASTHRLVSAPSPSDTILGGSAANQYALAPYDFAAIYDLLPLWTAAPTPITGAGQTVAIVGRSDINPADASYFWSSFGLDGVHAPEPTLVVTYNGPNPGKNDDESEADIDTQWSGAVAPGATINLVVSESTTTTDGVDLSALYIVDNNLAPVLSESYGDCEPTMGTSGVQFYGSLWQQAAAQGISVFVSSGDNGSAGCDDSGLPAKGGLHVNGIASTPYNAAVGGTDFNQYQAWTTYWNSTNDPVTQQSAKGYIPETTWNDSCTNQILQLVSGGSKSAEANCNNSTFSDLLNSTGGSGGLSSSWLKPVWQTGTPADNARDLPDVSLFAGNGFLNSYYYICQSETISGGCQWTGYRAFGGTSIASPQFAGIMALINQKTGSPQGIPGLVLYKLAAQKPEAFHDVPAGSTIAMPCVTGSPNCTTSKTGDAYGILSGYSTATGYDLATGLGSVDAAKLVNDWQSISFTSSATTLAVNGGTAVNITHGAAVPLTIDVTPAAATGDAALMVAPGKPGDPGIAVFHLASGAASASTTMLPGGSYSVLAHYAGDSNYGGSYSSPVAVNVSPESSLDFPNLITTDTNGAPTSYSTSTATYGSGYQLFRVDVGDSKASVSPASGISSLCASKKGSCPTGKVTLSSPGTSLDGQTLLLNNNGYVETAAPAPGTYAVTANYSGDASFAPSVGTASFSIAKAPTTVSANVLGLPVQYGTSEEIGAGVATTSDGVAPAGTFQFFVDGNPISVNVNIESFPYGGVANGKPNYASESGTSSTEFLSIGSHTLSVKYSGDANYAAGASAVATVSVVQATPSFSSWGVQNPGGNSVIVGQTATAVATVAGAQAGAAPTGTVTFYDGGTAIPGTVSYTSTNAGEGLDSALNATMSVVFSTAGTHQITVSYSGDANYTSANGATVQSLTVQGPVSVTPAGSVSISGPGQSGSTTLAVAANGGFTGTASLTCTPDPAASEATCSLTSGSSSGSTVQVNVTATAVNVTLNVTTTASHQTARLESPGSTPTVALAGILLVLLPLFKRNRRYFLCLIGLAVALSLGACGGGGSGGGGGTTDPGTSAGTYKFTIKATTGNGATLVTSSTQVTVTVN